MSINKYNPTTGSLEAISQGRVWVGTKAEWEATVQSGSYPKNVLVAITDDEQGPVDVVEKDNPEAVSSGAVYNAISKIATTATAGTLVSTNYVNFTAPSDGYITVWCTSTATNNYAILMLTDKNNNTLGQSGLVCPCSSAAYGRICLFLRKGQHCKFSSWGANGGYEFAPCTADA